MYTKVDAFGRAKDEICIWAVEWGVQEKIQVYVFGQSLQKSKQWAQSGHVRTTFSSSTRDSRSNLHSNQHKCLSTFIKVIPLTLH
jgi:hypothetical protein